MRVLIDTNVILDALMSREPWSGAAQELLRHAATEKFEGYILASQTTDIFYILQKKGCDEKAAKEIIAKLTSGIKIVDVTAADVRNALASPMTDYEDALLDCCAARQKAAFVITRNEWDFSDSATPAASPPVFLTRYLLT